MQFFGETMKNVRKHQNNKVVTKERRRNYLLSEPNATKFSTENLLAIEMRKT